MANLTAEEQLPMRTIHVSVRLKGPPPWRYEWRQVQARDLQEAGEIAAKAADVERVAEVSFIPGGVVT